MTGINSWKLNKWQAMPHDHQQWGICDHHQAWHLQTAQEDIKSTLCSANGILGAPPCLEGGTCEADSKMKHAKSTAVCCKRSKMSSSWGPNVAQAYDMVVHLKVLFWNPRAQPQSFLHIASDKVIPAKCGGVMTAWLEGPLVATNSTAG